MAASPAKTVDEYLGSLPPDRRDAVEAVRKVILENLPPGFEEGMQYGMLSYLVPFSRYPETYNGQPLTVAALASQKGYMAVYLMSVAGSPELTRWFENAYRATGKKLDMGKSCVRFKRLEDLPLDLVGEAIGKVGVDDFIVMQEAIRSPPKKASSKGSPKRSRA